MSKQLKSLWLLQQFDLIVSYPYFLKENQAVRAYESVALCISQFQLPLAQLQHLPASSVPGVRHLQILRRPGAGNIFANPGAIPEFLTRTRFPISTSTSPRGAYMWRGDLTEGFLRYRPGGLIFGEAYTWRGLFSEFYGITTQRILLKKIKSRLAHLSRTGACKGIFSMLCMHFFIAYQARIT